MSNYDQHFQQLAKDSGIPFSDSEIKSEFSALKEKEGLTVTNQSQFSPFWRFVDAIATKPALWVMQFVVLYVLPQSFLETASGIFVDLHGRAVNIQRKLAKKAEGFLLFTRDDSAGEFVIPAGVTIQSPLIKGKRYTVEVAESVTLVDGIATANVPVIALEKGSAYNLSEGYYTQVKGITGVAATNLDNWLTTPGADRETDDELKARTKNQYTAINQWHTDAVYRAIIAGFDGVTTENIYFLHDAPRGAGTANAYVMLESGNASADFIARIQRKISDEGNHGHGDDLMIYAMPEKSYDVSCRVWLDSRLSETSKNKLLTDIQNFIRCAFRENSDYAATKTYPYQIFSFSRLSSELHETFSSLENVVFELGFIESNLFIPRLGELTVTVQ